MGYFLIAELCDRKNDIILIFLNLPRLALWLSMWSILESVPCALEKNVKSPVLGEMLYKYQLNPTDLNCQLRTVLLFSFLSR